MYITDGLFTLNAETKAFLVLSASLLSKEVCSFSGDERFLGYANLNLSLREAKILLKLANSFRTKFVGNIKYMQRIQLLNKRPISSTIVIKSGSVN